MTIKTTFSLTHDPIKNSDEVAFNDSVSLSDAIAYLQQVLKEQGDIEVTAKIIALRPAVK